MTPSHFARSDDPRWATGGLFRWAALLAGSKNAVKGLGFLLGAALLALAGFVPALIAMATILSLILAATVVLMPGALPPGRRGAQFTEVRSGDGRIIRLSAARLFLFSARAVWFVVGIPLYFYGELSGGSTADNRAAFFTIGTFMALWIIGYGAVRAAAPRLLNACAAPLATLVAQTAAWALAVAAIPAALSPAAWTAPAAPWLLATLVAGLLVSGFVFALNSYLILAISTDARVSMDVGVYYMANAAGRLTGTLLSGLSFQIGGLALCLATAAAMAALSGLVARTLTATEVIPGASYR